MRFLDEAKVYVRSGEGGAGCVSFRREKFEPRGGPNGGNGGRGGDVIAECVEALNTLVDYRYRQHFKAPRGGHGMGRDRSGRAGVSVTLKLPVGTQIMEDDKVTLVGDLTKPGQRIVLCRGGDGGRGNAAFKSSTRRAPRDAEPGWPAEEHWLWLRLKLVADVGLIGLPNAGKSTFLAAVSHARPKVADYPFTTLIPVLGVVEVDGDELVMADIPGLIEGAHQGRGLGDRFLGHVERCGALVHLIDGTQDPDAIAAAYRTVRGELVAYGEGLAERDEILVLNKIDALTEAQRQAAVDALAVASRQDVQAISGVAGTGVRELLRLLMKKVATRHAELQERPVPAYSP